MGEMEEIVMTSMKKNGQAMVRLDRKKKSDINYSHVHHVAGGPYRGILINKMAENFDSVQEEDARIEFLAYIADRERDRSIQDKWCLRFWFRNGVEGIKKKNMSTEYFQELFNASTLPKNYIGFIKRALVLLQKYRLVTRIELEVQPNSGDMEDEDLPPIMSFTSVYTPAAYTYQFVPQVPISKKDFLTFKVKAAGEAHVALSAVYSDLQYKTHEIVLGAEGNTKSVLREGSLGKILAEAKTINVLSEKHFRYFWISWKNQRIQVGRGAKYGVKTFLDWPVPADKRFNISSLAVSTGRMSKGRWEFADILEEKDLEKSLRRNKIRESLLWLAKKQRMLQTLEDAYPNPVDVNSIFKRSNVKQSDSIQGIVMLKELERRGLIQEIEKGLWIRVQSTGQQVAHEVIIVKDLPTLTGKEQPTIAVITGLYCEKLAVDAMMDDKKTYIKFKTEGESQVYTVGRIGNYNVVSTKLSRLESGEQGEIAAENTVTRLLGTFNKVDHVFVCGVGGAVPHFSDFDKHIRLGDIVVSMPSEQNCGMYIYCSRVEKISDTAGYSYLTRAWDPRYDTLQKVVHKLQEEVKSNPTGTTPWEKYIEQGQAVLRGQESNFQRPKIWTDKLFYSKPDGTLVQLDHPRPKGLAAKAYVEGKVRVAYGAIASGRIVSKNQELKFDFSHMNGVRCFDHDYEAVIDSLEGNRNDSFLIIRGMCDYVDGRKKEWQPYASLVSAAYMKSVIMAL
ncbi:uncharacterized protein LOC121374324 isoform X2 [Gigantopelta aegis]|uniref:uncharacterized protein LOC121374324 isoform X2 n=1 Tax=Gigantopelta aegis TaxID=1735272 RepID=UPI001B889269|nr:uncharacterized protein LOC121374324 isoform X2 [Gigantopelta aegis]